MEFKFKTKPFPHQQEAFDKHKDQDFLALLADMGTGKSKIAIDIIAYKYLKGLHNRVLVIAPNAVHPQWADEQFPIHCPVPFEALSYSVKKTNKVIKERDMFMLQSKVDDERLRVFTINIEAFARDAGLKVAQQFLNTSKKPPAIIVDEASRIKNPSAKTVKGIKVLRDIYPDSFRLVLTGTPAAKKPVDLWSIYDFLQRKYMGCSYTAFQARYSLMYKAKLKIKGRTVVISKPLNAAVYKQIRQMILYNSEGKDLTDMQVHEIKHKFGLTDSDFWTIMGSANFLEHKNIKELQEKIAPVTFAVSKDDALELPPKIYQRIVLELNKEQKALIKNLVKHSVAIYEDEELTVEIKALLGTRVLQICGGFFSHHTEVEGKYDITPIKGVNAKLEFLVKDLEELGNQQFIIWAVFSPEIEAIQKRLLSDYEVETLNGETPKDKRQEIVNAFKRGEIQGLISHPEVGGYGLNLQGAGVQYWYSRNYRTEARLQAEDRSHRIGITESPIYKDLTYNIKFEQAVLDSLQSGQELNAHFLSKDINELFKI